MTESEVLEKIIEIVEPLDPIDLNTVIADSDDLDSLALFSIVVFLRQNGFTGSYENIAACKTVGDIVALIAK